MTSNIGFISSINHMFKGDGILSWVKKLEVAKFGSFDITSALIIRSNML